jgi:NitT/TauT family transport system substrate-binding protein
LSSYERLLSIIMGLAIILSSGCTAARAPDFRVGINSWPGYEFVYLAQELGFYKAADIDVRVLEFGSLSDCRRAFERGQIDAMGTTVVEVMQVRSRSSRSPQIISVMDYSNGADVIIAKITDGPPIAAGARVGVEIDSLGVYVLARGLKKYGLQLSDVKLVPMDQTSMQSAFLADELEALVTYPPTSVSLIKNKSLRAIFDTSEIPGEVVDVLASDEKWNQAHPEITDKFVRAVERAVAFTFENPQEAYPIMALREQLTVEEFGNALSDGIVLVAPREQDAFFTPGGKLEVVIAASDDILRKSGQLTGSVRVPGMINGDFISKDLN